MAKNQKHVDRLKAKLKATLNSNSKIHGVTPPKPAATANSSSTGAVKTSTTANITTNKSNAKPQMQKINKKPIQNSNGPTATTTIQSQKTTKSTQSKQKTPKMASNVNVKEVPKVRPVEIPDNKPKIKSESKMNQKVQNHTVKADKKKKKKQKKKKPNATAPVDLKPHESPPIQDKNKGKRKLELPQTNGNVQTKRLKCDKNGFIETNIDSDVELVESNEAKSPPPKKIKKKKSKKIQSNKMEDAAGPSVKVIDIDENQLNGLDDDSDGDHSDSEADSYIDKFFGGDDNEFNENRIYSVDEIETKNRNFLAKASGVRTQSDDDTSSSEGIHVHNTDSESNLSEMESSKGQTKHPMSNNLEKYSGSNDYSGESMDDSEYDEDDDDDDVNGDMFYGSDSDVSLGSAVDSDDLDDTYECESSEESADGYEMNSSYDDNDDDEDNSEFDESDHSNYSYSESHSSNDTYDEFMNRRHYDSSNDDQDYDDSQYDDLRIAQGTAVTYKITDKRIKIFENDTESRIIEVPKTDSDDEKCVDLIPITVSRTKFMRIERQKSIAEQAKLDEKKMKDEMARVAHEKAVSDYYNMDNLSGASLKSHTNDVLFNHPPSTTTTHPINSVSIIKCPKNFKHVTLDWMEVDDVDEQMHNEVDIDSVYPKSKAKNIISIQGKTKLEKHSKKSKTQTDKLDLGQVSSVNQVVETVSEKQTTKVDHGKSPKATIASNKQSKQSSTEIKPTENESTTNKPMESQFFNSINSRHVLLLLRNELHFHGSLHVKLIAGHVTAFGYQLQHNKTVTLHSPRGHGFINLIAGPSSSTDQQQYLRALDNLAADFYSQDISYLKTQMNCTSDAILLLERDQTNKGVNMIDRYMRETMFPNINAFNNDSPFYSSEFVLHCKFFTEPDNGLVHNEQWSTIKLCSSTKLVAIGGKGVGKSTFMRYLINSNIGKFPKFLFIDLDIGQPELFVPQTLSATVVTEPILGPGYLKNFKPSKSVLFGDINVLPNPIKYLRCVMEIFEFCSSHSEFSKIPWIINTMGYSRGFGSELMACILKIIQPSDVIQIQSRMYADNFDQIMNADTVNTFKFNVFEREMADTTTRCQYKMHIFDAMRGKNGRKTTDMTAKDLRYTMILAKLGNCLKYNTDWLTSVKPFEASLNNLDVLITSGEEVAQSDYLDLLNGNLVYLCWRQPEQTNDIIDCHGIGIVRSVDAQTRKLYLLSTISLAEMQHVNVLAIGAIPLPSAVFLNQHMQVRGAVPYVYNSDNFIGSKQVAQHIFRAEGKATNKPIKLMEEN